MAGFSRSCPAQTFQVRSIFCTFVVLAIINIRDHHKYGKQSRPISEVIMGGVEWCLRSCPRPQMSPGRHWRGRGGHRGASRGCVRAVRRPLTDPAERRAPARSRAGKTSGKDHKDEVGASCRLHLVRRCFILSCWSCRGDRGASFSLREGYLTDSKSPAAATVAVELAF